MEQSQFTFDINFDEDPKKKGKTSKKKRVKARIKRERVGNEADSSKVERRVEAESKEPHIFTVSEINGAVKSILEKKYSDIWVVGEVSGFKPSSTGHYYFQLKDEKAVLRSIIWKGIKAKIPFEIKDGMELVCFGKLNLYVPGGSYGFVIESCEPKGMGALQLAFEQLKKKLEEEGLFKKERKKSLPYLPKKIGVVTAETGAAIRDIINVLSRRFPGIEILLNPVKVQGQGSAEEIARAIFELDQRGDIDVMIVGRGGGSLEDLWAFNEEIVARAIFSAKTPIVSAVGHEIDFTISDFVADLRAPTPSAAAEIVVPDKKDLISFINNLKKRYLLLIKTNLESMWKGVQFLKGQIKDPSLRFSDLLIHLDGLAQRLTYSTQVAIDNRRANLSKIISSLEHLSPLNILSKGYAVVKKHGEGELLKSAKGLKINDILDVRLNIGELETKITKIID